MQTFGDMKERLRDDLRVSTSSTLFTTDRLEKLINDAYLWATALYSWPQLEKSKQSTTPAIYDSEQYMDYPDEYRTDTLAEVIYINDKPFERKSWNTFLEHKRLNPTSTRRIFADYGRQIFIYPHQTEGLTVVLYGQVQPDLLVEDADLSVFAKHDDSCNEAVVRKAFSTATRRIDKEASREEEQSAVTILSVAWKKIQDRQQYAQQLNKPMFDVANYFPVNGATYSERNFDIGFFDED